MGFPLFTDYFDSLPVYYFISVTFLFLSIEFYGAYFISSGFHLKAVCKGNTLNNQIAISFDDGPDSETNAILDVLKEFQTPATFFLIGNKINNRTQIIQRMHQEGHIIGNHTFTHGLWIDFKTTKGFVKEIESTSAAIHQIIGKRPLYFRPPYGVTTPALARAVKKLKLQVIGWNIRSLDTSIQNKNSVLKRIQARIQPGAILLMHDTVQNNSELLKEILIFLRKQNYEVVSIEKLINQPCYA